MTAPITLYDVAALSDGLMPLAVEAIEALGLWGEASDRARRLLRRQCQWHLAQWLAFVVAFACAAILGR